MKRTYYVPVPSESRKGFVKSVFLIAARAGVNVYVVRRRATIREFWIYRKNRIFFRNRMNIYSFRPECSDEGIAFLCSIRSWHMNALYVFLARQDVIEGVLGSLPKMQKNVAAQVKLGQNIPLLIDFFDEDARLHADDSVSHLIAQLLTDAEIDPS